MYLRRMLVVGLPFISGVLFCPSLSAQGPEESEPDQWRTQIDLGLNSASGNRSLTTLITGISLKRLATEKIELELSADYRYGTSEGATAADQFRTRLKMDIHPVAVWSPFLFASTERNPIRRLDLLANGGAGLKYTNWRTERGKSSVSLATIFNYEDLDASGATVVEAEKTVRWSGRVKLNLYFGTGAEFEFIAFHQPVWNKLTDYYLSMDTSLRVPVAAGLSLVARNQFRHDETPPSGVRQDDNYVTVSFRYIL